MSITPEQFNKLVFKEDLENLEKRLSTRKQIEKLQNTMDSIVVDYKKFDIERLSTQEALKRIQENINEVRKEVGMDTIPVV